MLENVCEREIKKKTAEEKMSMIWDCAYLTTVGICTQVRHARKEERL